MRALSTYLAVLLLLLLPFTSSSQMVYNVDFDDSDIQLDGHLNEAQWKKAEVASNFINNYPEFGVESEFPSEVRMYYDNDAIYIGGILRDPEPDSVSYTLSQRDNMGNADWFGVMLDPYANNVSSFGFIVTSAGVEMDGMLFTQGSDWSWNAVWKSRVAKRDDGWSFEIRIPFSAVRFPNKDIQEWNINFVRMVRRNREKSYWNPVDPNVFGEITQTGKMFGMRDIKAPVRLSLTPYATTYLENFYDDNQGKQVWGSRVTGGLDLKYGLNDAFTLDMTLIPDFGQTVSDNQVLNLGPFEVRFAENRPFFLEGTDLFRIGGIFYSRRIGAQPHDYWDAYANLSDSLQEEVVSNPALAPMLNGTKVSGRTKSGLGIGVFNAIEGRSFATIRNMHGEEREVRTNPFSNYNVFVLSQNLANNSRVSLVNTNVMREGQARDANVTAFESAMFTPDQKYAVDMMVRLSNVYEDGAYKTGHTIFGGVRKVSGSVRYELGYGEESDSYDPNDLGFLRANNSRFFNTRLMFNDFVPKGRILRKSLNFSQWYEELYSPQLYANFNLGWSTRVTFRNFLSTGLHGGFNPFGTVNHFESRQFGKEVRFAPSYRVGGFYSSDYSKKFAIDFRGNWRQFAGTDQYSVSGNVSPRVRLWERMFIVLRSNAEFIHDDYGYVSIIDDNYSDEIILGYRDRTIVENSINMEFIFTNRMGIDLRLRHYWQQVKYNRFGELQDAGYLEESDYFPMADDGSSLHNTSYNAFTLDVNYRWVFIPGSELRVVYKNNIFNSQQQIIPSYFSNFQTLFAQPQINSISVKILVFLDAIYLRKGNKTGIR